MTSPPPTEKPVASPCVNVCRMEGELCRGCARTLDEIARWSSACEAERRQILARLPARRQARGWGALR